MAWGVCRRTAVAVSAIAVALGVSCNSQNFQKTYAVKGRVTVDGKAALECMITLNRTFDDNHPNKVIPYGMTDEQGYFKLSSYQQDDGAPEGDYVITITWKMRSGIMQNNFDGPDRLDGEYANMENNRNRKGFVVKVGREPLDLGELSITQSATAKKKIDDYERRKAKQGGLMSEER